MGQPDAVRELLARLRGFAVDPADVAARLDGMSHAERVEAIRSLGRAEQRRLYEAVDGFASLRLLDLVPAGVGELVTVRHFGRNTLPLFTHFEKRFCRPRGEDPEKPSALYGFNHQSLSRLTGPGCFVARNDETRPEVLIDYREVPPERPGGWPEIRSNERGLARLVYGGMVDTLRRVSEHVSIGSAARGGRDLGSWFVLCREA
ncbi:MAG: hypothetical protein JSU66_17630 [Deltaproteobacteria bacterium]|nr:MAG: hypothetical protein JSU66_17630 [Deltaproteobacteria bacterium]